MSHANIEEKIEDLKARRSRRRFLTQASLAGAAALVGGGMLGSAQRSASAANITPDGPRRAAATVTDADILNFALNLEYLEAEYYLHATTGAGLAPANIDGKIGTGGRLRHGSPGAVTVKGSSTIVPWSVLAIHQYANEVAADEMNHVLFLRAALGEDKIARPPIDLLNSFNAAANAAGIGSTFDPFASDDDFLLGAFIFEDVGVTAYHGAAALISTPSTLTAAAGILGTEAYHAGLVRSTLFARGASTPALLTDANAISALRASADGSGGTGHEQPLTSGGLPIIVPADSNSIVYARTTDEVLRIVYLGGAPGGFFPSGVYGKIQLS